MEKIEPQAEIGLEPFQEFADDADVRGQVVQLRLFNDSVPSAGTPTEVSKKSRRPGSTQSARLT